jgi:hypothetical protein
MKAFTGKSALRLMTSREAPRSPVVTSKSQLC